jgi:hypothetical protein
MTPSPSWTDIVSALGSVLSAIVTAAGFTLVVIQLRHARKTMEITTFEHLYSRMHDIHKVLVERPHLRAYFYDSAESSPDSANHSEVCAAAEMIADFFQQVSLQLDLMPAKTADGWRAYMSSTVKTSPVLKAFLASHATWYPNNFLQVAPHATKPEA